MERANGGTKNIQPKNFENILRPAGSHFQDSSALPFNDFVMIAYWILRHLNCVLKIIFTVPGRT